jgi:hypothetical protein
MGRCTVGRVPGARMGRCPGVVVGHGRFNPLAFVSFFLFSDNIQIIVSSKICASLK